MTGCQHNQKYAENPCNVGSGEDEDAEEGVFDKEGRRLRLIPGGGGWVLESGLAWEIEKSKPTPRDLYREKQERKRR